MQCPNCRFENAEDAQRCSRCGIVLNLRDVDLSDLQPQEPEARPQPPPSKKGWSCGIIGCVVVAVLLIGMFVISMVAAVVFPVFSRAREKAGQTSCMANLKQLQLGTLMYMQDYHEVMPSAANWCDATMPYIKNSAVFVCPEASGAAGTYAMNDAVSGQKLSAFASPAQTVCLFDSTTGWNMHGGPSLIADRHNGGANFAFVDGHVKWVASGSASSYTWSVTPPPAGSGATGGP